MIIGSSLPSLLSPGLTAAHPIKRVTWGGRPNSGPRDVQALIPRTCEDVTLHGKGDFADVIKMKGEMLLGHPGGPKVITGPLEMEEGSRRVGQMGVTLE